MNESRLDMPTILTKMLNKTKADIHCFRIGKIVTKNANGSYQVLLIDTLTNGVTVTSPTLLDNVIKVNQGNKSQSLAIEYIVGEFVLLGFNDISFSAWKNGADSNIENMSDTNRHIISDAFIIGRVARGNDASPKMELSLFFNNILDNVISALQTVKDIEALDSLGVPVTFLNLSLLDININKLQTDKTNIQKLFE